MRSRFQRQTALGTRKTLLRITVISATTIVWKEKRLAELDKLFAKLYEEHINGKVSERNYNSLSAAYETEQTELESRIAELNSVIKAERENGENAENFVDLIKQYADIEELTQALLNTLIDRIEVHEPEDVDGEFIQKLDVYYKFVGRLD